jgi:uncharacterized protein YutD
MVMIKYDLIISDHHLNQRHLRSMHFNGTLITQMVMIRYDFIISDHHLNQRHLRSIVLVFPEFDTCYFYQVN